MTTSYVYFAKSKLGDPIKVGLTELPRKRCADLKATLLGVYRMPSRWKAYELEQKIHAELVEFRVVDEWYAPNELLDKHIAESIMPGPDVRQDQHGSMVIA